MGANSMLDLLGSDNLTATMRVLVFLSASTLAFALMIGVTAREAVRRRAARIGPDEDSDGGRRSLRHAGLRAAQTLIEYTTKHYSAVDDENVKILRRRLVQAGIYSPHGAAIFFIARGLTAVAVTGASFFLLPMLGFGGKTSFWLFLMVGGLFGYLAPSFILDRIIEKKRVQHQGGSVLLQNQRLERR